MTEYLPVLDEDGHPTGRSEARKIVHQTGLWHATVHIYVYDVRDSTPVILAHLRSPHKDLYPSTWDPVLGGHVTEGTSPKVTARKELAEEANIVTLPGELILGPVVKADKGLDREFNHIFLCRLPNGTKLQFNDGEVADVRWLTLEEIEAELTVDSRGASSRQWRPTLAEFLNVKKFLTTSIR